MFIGKKEFNIYLWEEKRCLNAIIYLTLMSERQCTSFLKERKGKRIICQSLQQDGGNISKLLMHVRCSLFLDYLCEYLEQTYKVYVPIIIINSTVITIIYLYRQMRNLRFRTTKWLFTWDLNIGNFAPETVYLLCYTASHITALLFSSEGETTLKN